MDRVSTERQLSGEHRKWRNKARRKRRKQLTSETMAKRLVVKLAHWKRLVHEGGYEQFPRHLAEVETELGLCRYLLTQVVSLYGLLPLSILSWPWRSSRDSTHNSSMRLLVEGFKVATAGECIDQILNCTSSLVCIRILRMILTQVDHRAWVDVNLHCCYSAPCMLSPSTSVAPTAEGTPEEKHAPLFI